jgi:hypothetical protein
MPFFTCRRLLLKECSPQDFLRLWAPLYREGPVGDEVLKQNLNLDRNLEVRHLEPLIHWRLQKDLDRKALDSVNRLGRSLETINTFRAKGKLSEDEILDFYEQAAAWVPEDLILRVFILHVARPHQFPLFDSSLYLAHQVLTDNPPGPPRPLGPDDDGAYFSFMKTFFQMETAGARPKEDLVKALSAFGRFLTDFGTALQF